MSKKTESTLSITENPAHEDFLFSEFFGTNQVFQARRPHTGIDRAAAEIKHRDGGGGYEFTRAAEPHLIPCQEFQQCVETGVVSYEQECLRIRALSLDYSQQII